MIEAPWFKPTTVTCLSCLSYSGTSRCGVDSCIYCCLFNGSNVLSHSESHVMNNLEVMHKMNNAGSVKDYLIGFGIVSGFNGYSILAVMAVRF